MLLPKTIEVDYRNVVISNFLQRPLLVPILNTVIVWLYNISMPNYVTTQDSEGNQCLLKGLKSVTA